MHFTTLISGFGFGLSLIVAIGSQNAFVLRQGIGRQHVLAVVSICAVSDAVLISLGITGLASVLDSAPGMLDAIAIGGAAFLYSYAVLAIKRALKPLSLRARDESSTTLARAVAVALTLTWLNPHVYLDTALLIGSVANTHGDQRWTFGVGAISASIVWFVSLGYGAQLLGPLFAKRAAWRVLDIVIAITMSAIATSLVANVLPTVRLPGWVIGSLLPQALLLE